MKTTNTKRALFLSAVSMLLCVVMLASTTFAWFTDTVESARNNISSGNLDLVVEYKTPDMDAWETLDESVKLFNDDAKWEPGYTEAVYLKLTNNGELAFNYEIAMNIFEEKAGVNVLEKQFKLSEFINAGASANSDYANEIAEYFMATYDSREAIAALATNKLVDGQNILPNNEEALPAGNSVYCVLAVAMPTSVDNRANYLADDEMTNKPSIELGVSILAKQASVSEEADDFGHDYDENSQYATPIVADPEGLAANTDTENQTVAIGTAGELVAFADAVNAGEAYKSYNVTLTSDIDLSGYNWIPIGQTGSPGEFTGTFDGAGYTISNLYVEASHEEGAHYAVGLFGFIDAHGAVIKNVNVDNATVVGHHYAAVIAGYLSGEITGCTVTNSSVSCTHVNDDADGDKAGIIAGYLNETNTKVTGNTVKNCTVSAGRDAGQVVGCSTIEGQIVSDNIVENVIVTANGTSTGANIKNEPVGRTE